MAEDKQDLNHILLINTFYIRNKRHRITLTKNSICWEPESAPDLCTVLPLSEVIAITPCDCNGDQTSRTIQCHHCRHSRDQVSPAISELVPLQAQAVRLYYAIRVGKYRWSLTSILLRPVELNVLREFISNLQATLNGKEGQLLHLAGIVAHVIVTQRANHAKDMLQELDLKQFDGIICVGGDGMFSELLNGLILRIQREEDLDINDPFTFLKRPTIPLGVIPAGSTDAVAYSSNGTNDPVTSTLLIIMGDQINVDISSLHHEGTLLRYSISFLAYGYFGDTLFESEKHRWMGPKRYSWSGFKKVLQHQSYDGELQLQVVNMNNSPYWQHDRCQAGCSVCVKVKEKLKNSKSQFFDEEKLRWLTVKGKFMCVNVATMSCKCGMSREGISPCAHRGDGCVDVVVVSRCSRFNYIRYLFRTSFHNQSPFDLNFVQLYRVREFRFSPYVSEGDRTPAATCTGVQDSQRRLVTSMWNCDGEVITEPMIHVR
ncbi:ceramide kinase-like [Centruroides sculpturatus]|uniref:ceramide kinase-like n=1 Tax=Centruroides sculpturatus TaxID=218467 RepID=UPI000C6ED599|nr:ceramide kinase-like [Centruroides sculpturatus]